MCIKAASCQGSWSCPTLPIVSPCRWPAALLLGWQPCSFRFTSTDRSPSVPLVLGLSHLRLLTSPRDCSVLQAFLCALAGFVNSWGVSPQVHARCIHFHSDFFLTAGSGTSSVPASVPIFSASVPSLSFLLSVFSSAPFDQSAKKKDDDDDNGDAGL